MIIPGGPLADRKAVDEGLYFCARVDWRDVSHVLSFPQVRSYTPPDEELNMQYYTTWRQCPAFCMDELSTLSLTFNRILIFRSFYASSL